MSNYLVVDSTVLINLWRASGGNEAIGAKSCQDRRCLGISTADNTFGRIRSEVRRGDIGLSKTFHDG
jgi:hypothetical protein